MRRLLPWQHLQFRAGEGPKAGATEVCARETTCLQVQSQSAGRRSGGSGELQIRGISIYVVVIDADIGGG